MRELLASADPRAAFAVDYFVYRVGLNAGMLAAALQGLDAFVFTAGIGENSATDPRAHCREAGLARRGLDPAANAECRHDIAPDSRFPIYVVPTDEELMIASIRCRAVRTIAPAPEYKRTACIHSRRQGAPPRRQEGPDRGHRQRSIDCLGLRQGLPRAGRELAVTYLNKRPKGLSNRSAGAGIPRSSCHSTSPSPDRWRKSSNA